MDNSQNTLPKPVLFVCVENSCRSQIAEAFAHIYGKDPNGKEIAKPYSAGSRPSGKINPKAIESMRELGYDLSRHKSKSLAEIPDIEYEYAITMGCGDECPFVTAEFREDWNIPDPKDMNPEDFNSVRNLIEERVKILLAKVASETAKKQ
jgi:arsenate reductase (thioredoxin)